MVVFGLAVAAGGAGAVAVADAAPVIHAAPIAEPLMVGSDDDGHAVTMTVGQELAVALPDNPSTGYRWQLGDLDQNVLRVDGDPQTRANPAGGFVPGGPDQAVWTFAAESPGTTTLTLVSARPWEQSAPSGPRYSLTVTVK
ncbi:protease inhibitor I42 family protein [Nocardia sp. BMG111209]|uniref:protease inhibitor I42 family protein n=1 Tax=Nocardia sp. BMG111209 TaxID=1160137 RepID=UPI0003774483|nr:protease inhibitor I42 family protein [Nocardia sp. BMG111209]